MGLFFIYASCVSVPFSLMISCSERAVVLAILLGMFSCVFVTFPSVVLDCIDFDRCLPFFVSTLHMPV